MKSALPLVLTALAVACGGGTASSFSSSSSTTTGTVGGSTLHAASAVAVYGTIATSNGAPIKGLRIRVSDKANTCSSLHNAGATIVDIAIRGDTVKIGTYAVINAGLKTPDANEAEADFNAVDGTCKDVVAQTATNGTVTITQADTKIVGSLDVTFAGGHVAGDFDAELCSPTAAPTGDGTCSQ